MQVCHTVVVRRLLPLCAAAFCAVGCLAWPAAASAAPTPPRTVCDIDDEKLPDVTGLTSMPGGGYAAVTRKPVPLRIFTLDAKCKPTRILNDPAITPFSIQDLARTPDGVLWVADIGDLERGRDNISIFKVPAGAKKATRYRLTYPDGKHDAAALLVQPNGVPVVIARDHLGGGVSKIYSTGAPLTAPTTALKAVGTFTVPKSSTSGGKLGKVSQTLVSGAALAPDGKRIVVRTLTDAYEWDIETDIVTTLASGKAPRATPLPNESVGEAITYTTDGAGFVTANASQPGRLQEWTPAPLPEPSSAAKAAAPAVAAGDDDSFSLKNLTFDQLGGLILGVGAVGLVMLVAGIVGIVRFRRRQGEPEEPSLDARLAEAQANPYGGPDGMAPVEETMAMPSVGPGAGAPMTAVLTAEPGTRGTVYGGGGDARRGGTVYGAPPAPQAPPEAQRGTVYGGTTYGSGAQNGTTYGTSTSGTTYGSGAAGGQPPAAGGAQPRGTTYGGGAPGAPGADAPGPRQGSVYGRPPTPPAGPPAPQGPRGIGSAQGRGAGYGGAPQSSVYGGAPQGGGSVYGGQGDAPQGGGSVYGGQGGAGQGGAGQGGAPGGNVYGGRSTGDVDGRGRGRGDAIHEVPPRSSRDWRSRRPPE